MFKKIITIILILTFLPGYSYALRPVANAGYMHSKDTLRPVASAVTHKVNIDDLKIGSDSFKDICLSVIDELRDESFMVGGISAQQIAQYLNSDNVVKIEEELNYLTEQGLLLTFTTSALIDEAGKDILADVQKQYEKGEMDYFALINKQYEVNREYGGARFLLTPAELNKRRCSQKRAKALAADESRLRQFAEGVSIFLDDRLNATLYSTLTRLFFVGEYTEDENVQQAIAIAEKLNSKIDEIRTSKLRQIIIDARRDHKTAELDLKLIYEYFRHVREKIPEILALVQALKNIDISTARDGLDADEIAYVKLYQNQIKTAYAHLCFVFDMYVAIADNIEAFPSQGGSIGEVDSLRVVDIKDIGEGRVEISAMMRRYNKEVEQPITLFGKRAPAGTIKYEVLANLRTGSKKFDDAFTDILKEIPQENIIILDENLEKIRGFGQFKGIPVVGLVEALIDDEIAQWHEYMHAAYDADMFDIVEIHDFVHKHPGNERIKTDFFSRTSRTGHTNSVLVHYALINMATCRWPWENEDLTRKIKQPITLPDDKGDLDTRIAKRLNRRTSACQMWEFLDYVGRGMGHKRIDVQIELINQCPMACAHCLDWDKLMQCPHTQMSIDEAQRILVSLAGAEEICFTGGEPFLYFNTVEGLKRGHVSNEFLNIIEFASQCVDRVVIDTCGLVVPKDKGKAEEFFAQFPENVVFEFSLDSEHEDGLRRLTKNRKGLKDIVKAAELAYESGREIRYNVRSHRRISENGFAAFVAPWDYKGRVAKRYEHGEYVYQFSRSEKKIRLSRTKLQSNAVREFEEKGGSLFDDYTMMEIDSFVQHLFPSNTFLFISNDGRLFFDAHSNYMPTPPAISCLGDINQSSLSGVMFDGMVGRLVNFDEHPYLRYLYLARYFHDSGDDSIAADCLAYAEATGSEYQDRYKELTNTSFEDIAFKNRYFFEQHFYIATIDNILTHNNLPWLQEALPKDVPVVWQAGKKYEGRESMDSIGGIKTSEIAKMDDQLVAACIRDYIKHSEKRAESITACVNEILNILHSNKTISSAHTLAFKTEKDGMFLFIPRSIDITPIRVFDDEKGTFFSPELVTKGFRQYAELMEIYLGEYSALFFKLLNKELENYLSQEQERKRRWVAEQCLQICREKIENPIQPCDVTIADWFIWRFQWDLSNLHSNVRSLYRTSRSYYSEDLNQKLKAGLLTPIADLECKSFANTSELFISEMLAVSA